MEFDGRGQLKVKVEAAQSPSCHGASGLGFIADMAVHLPILDAGIRETGVSRVTQ
jgi:hypothetical protein